MIQLFGRVSLLISWFGREQGWLQLIARISPALVAAVARIIGTKQLVYDDFGRTAIHHLALTGRAAAVAALVGQYPKMALSFNSTHRVDGEDSSELSAGILKVMDQILHDF